MTGAEQAKRWLTGKRMKVGTVLSVDHPSVVEMAKLAGFDWLWIDAEHGSFNERSAAWACAITSGTVPTFVRVPDLADSTIKRYLDIGADGLILPQVSSVEQARSVARAGLYPPHGQRSVGIGRAHGYGGYFADYLRERRYALIAQIESVGGVADADAIIAEPYIDAILIGPYDLSGSCGVPGDIGCEQVQRGIATVLAACKRAEKPCGIFAANAAAARTYAAQGFDFAGVGLDAAILTAAYKALRADVGC